MTTFKITLAYDGTDYIGWQRQASGTSIQGLVEDVLRDLDDRDVTVHGAGRTDAGVHALGQVASFSLERSIDAATLVRALNAHLPPDVRVRSAEPVSSTFHARFDAQSKTYQYRIWNDEVLNPFERRYVWHLVGALDVDAMARAARMLEGVHDFAAFQGTGSEAKTTVRTILNCGLRIADWGLIEESRIQSHDQSAVRNPHSAMMIVFVIEGEGFLRHMVRAIVGSLVEVGRGRREPAWIADVLESRSRAAAGQTAPPQGLFLASVQYGNALAAEP